MNESHNDRKGETLAFSPTRPPPSPPSPIPTSHASDLGASSGSGTPSNLEFNETLVVIGRGRLAQALWQWPRSGQTEIRRWHRQESLEELDRVLEGASHVLLAIRDDALENFLLAQSIRLRSKTLVHFAGSRGDLLCAGLCCYVAHPLMSLSVPPPPLDLLQDVRFSISGAQPLSKLLPGFDNTSFVIADEDRALYHALLSLGGNLGVWLWEQMEREFATQFGSAGPESNSGRDPRSILQPYLDSLFWALRTRRPETSALTGPIARGDLGTINRQTEALAVRPDLQQIFKVICGRAVVDRSTSTPPITEERP